MSENIQNSYDFDRFYFLVEEIVTKRKFECLVELDQQCGFILQAVKENVFSQVNEQASYLDCSFIFLYYIYYIMLKEDEELIFPNLRALIMYHNNELVKFYYNNETAIIATKEGYLKNGETELYNLYILAMYILNKYNSQCGSSDLNDLGDPNPSKIINILYRNNYVAISNELYIICLLGNKVLNYREVLERSAYDNLQSRLYDILLVILDKYHRGILFSDGLGEEDETDGILEEAGALNW